MVWATDNSSAEQTDDEVIRVLDLVGTDPGQLLSQILTAPEACPGVLMTEEARLALDVLVTRISDSQIRSRVEPDLEDLMFIEAIDFGTPFKAGENEVCSARQYFQNGKGKNHYGLDLHVNCADKMLLAIADGEVIENRWSTSYGHMMVIKLKGNPNLKLREPAADETADSYYILLAHMASKPKYSVGDELTKGDELAKQGNTGVSNGKRVGHHLHLELLKNYDGKGYTSAESMNPEAFPHFYEAVMGRAISSDRNYADPGENYNGLTAHEIEVMLTSEDVSVGN